MAGVRAPIASHFVCVKDRITKYSNFSNRTNMQIFYKSFFGSVISVFNLVYINHFLYYIKNNFEFILLNNHIFMINLKSHNNHWKCPHDYLSL